MSLRDIECLSRGMTCSFGSRLDCGFVVLLENARFASAFIRLIMVVLPYHCGS